MSSPDFVPKIRHIANISTAMNAVVTTTAAHGYSSGSHVVLVVPPRYGMRLDYVDVTITVTGLTTFITDLDTSQMDAYNPPIRIVNAVTNAVGSLITTTLEHNLEIGDRVVFQNCVGVAAGFNNQVFGVVTIPSTTTFTINNLVLPGAGYVANSGTVGLITTQSHCCPASQLEDNIALF